MFMTFHELNIVGAWVNSPSRFEDDRGYFDEVARFGALSSFTGKEFLAAQLNQSHSKLGVIRGIHYSVGPAAQEKFVFCPSGVILDILVDLRLSSPTFGSWDTVTLSAENGKSVFIPAGVGHAFLSLEQNSISTYICSSEYEPHADRSINIFSPELSINLEPYTSKYGIKELILSPKDESAPVFEIATFTGN